VTVGSHSVWQARSVARVNRTACDFIQVGRGARAGRAGFERLTRYRDDLYEMLGRFRVLEIVRASALFKFNRRGGRTQARARPEPQAVLARRVAGGPGGSRCHESVTHGQPVRASHY
jgi:hypothetical protein